MRDPERRRRILDHLEVLWGRPGWGDMRFGQFLINLGLSSDDNTVWHREDDDLEDSLVAYRLKGE